MSVCSYHVTYAFLSVSTLYSCLNVKELLAQSRRKIWSLSDCNWTRTHHLVTELCNPQLLTHPFVLKNSYVYIHCIVAKYLTTLHNLASQTILCTDLNPAFGILGYVILGKDHCMKVIYKNYRQIDLIVDFIIPHIISWKLIWIIKKNEWN